MPQPSNPQPHGPVLARGIYAAGMLNYEEFQAIPELYLRYKRPPWNVMSRRGLVVAIAGLFLIGWISRHPESIFAWVCLALMAAGFAILSFLGWGNQRRSWEESPLKKTTFQFQFTTEGVKTVSEFHPWSEFTGFCDSESALYLYQKENLFMFIPRRWFKTHEDWDTLVPFLGHLDHMEMLRR